MIQSMTGFGQAEIAKKEYNIRVELRSVNNRSLKVVCRMPDAFAGREMDVERILREQLHRGAVYATIEFTDLSGDPGYAVDARVVRAYWRTLEELKRELCLEQPTPLAGLLTLPGALTKSPGLAANADAVWADVADAIRQAMVQLVRTRASEGAFLWEATQRHNRRIAALLGEIEERLPKAIADYRARLEERLDALLAGKGIVVEQTMIEREVALLAERSGIAEELDRLRSHLVHFDRAPAEDPSCGRKLEFIVQEMFREANTMASKAGDDPLLRCVLDLKNEIDKLREQTQNVE